MPELLIDFITSLDGYGAAEGWPGWWAVEGPEYLAWLGDQPEKDYTLLMGAIALMHRLSRRDFDRSREMLVALTERLPRQAIPWAWLAKWHVLRVQQGWSLDPQVDAQFALDCGRRALSACGAAPAPRRRTGAAPLP